MANLTVSHKTLGTGTIQGIETRSKLEHCFVSIQFDKDKSTRRFLIYDNVGKLHPFFKFFEKDNELVAYFEKYQEDYYTKIRGTFIAQEREKEIAAANKKEVEEVAVNLTEDNLRPIEEIEINKVEDINNKNEGIEKEIIEVNSEPVEKNSKPKAVKKTANKEVTKTDTVKSAPIKRGRGRPKGSGKK